MLEADEVWILEKNSLSLKNGNRKRTRKIKRKHVKESGRKTVIKAKMNAS